MQSENWQRMIRGLEFNPLTPELNAQRQFIRQRVAQFNRAPNRGNLKQVFDLFSSVGESCFIEGGVHIDYGSQITLGDRVYINAHCVFLDAAPISIAEDVLIGPAVQFYTAEHPKEVQKRNAGIMIAKPIVIGGGAWIGGGAILLSGITIGERAIVAAGAVVTKDVPADCLVMGNPARIR